MKFWSKFFWPAMALVANEAQAIDWLMEPNFRVSERYTDNLRMQAKPKRDNFITKLSPGILLGYQAESDVLKTTFQWNELIYHDDSSLDFSEKIANLNHQFLGQRFKTDVSARYAEQSTINTQLDIDGSGDLQIQIPRTTLSASPSVTYNFTEKYALQLGYSYTDVSFDRGPKLQTGIRYSDYDNQQFSATLIHTFSQRLTLNLSTSYSEFNSANTSHQADVFTQVIPGVGRVDIDGVYTTAFEQQSNTLFYQAGLQFIYDPKTQISLSAGLRDTENSTLYDRAFTPDGATESLSLGSLIRANNNLGHVFSVDLKHSREWGGFSMRAGQQLNPSSVGSQMQSTMFSANGFFNFNEQWSAGLAASYQMSEAISNTTGGSNLYNRIYSSITPNIRWRWSPEITFELSYSYRQREYENTNITAISNSAQLQFSYQPKINNQVK